MDNDDDAAFALLIVACIGIVIAAICYLAFTLYLNAQYVAAMQAALSH